MMAKPYFNADNIGTDLNQFGQMADQYWKFIDHFTRNDPPSFIDAMGMAKHNLHDDPLETVGGVQAYFPAQSGTTEGQFLAIRGMLMYYGVSRDMKWLNLAEKMMNAAIKLLYRGVPMPDNYDENNLWLPQWLFNASAPFTSAKFYLDKRVTFINGVGTFTADYLAQKIFSVRSLDATLDWENPYAKVITGTEYTVSSFSTSGKQFTVQLQEPVSADLLVVYSDLGGPVINSDQVFEAWPVWHELADTEINCAGDSIWWLYDCYKLLAEYTGNPKYAKALDLLKQTIPKVCNVDNMDDYFTVDFLHPDNPLFLAGSFSYQTRSPEATFTRNMATGAMDVDAPYGDGFIQFMRGDLETTFDAEMYFEAKLRTNKTNVLTLIITTSPDQYTPEYRWSCRFFLSESAVPQTLTFHREDFIQTSGLIWDLFNLPQSSYSGNYASSNSTSETSLVQDGLRGVAKTVFHIAEEIDGAGNPYTGWAQFMPIWDGSGSIAGIPKFTYRANGAINIRIKDTNGWIFTATLPERASLGTLQLVPADFDASSFQTNTGTPPQTPTFPLKEFLFEAVDVDAALYLAYIGEPTVMPLDTKYYSVLFEIDDPTDQVLSVYYLRPLPLRGYPYTPYVMPFGASLMHGQLSDWRGTPYVGYQAPYIWQPGYLDNADALNTVLDFMIASQDAYEAQTGRRGFFIQVFIWDRWDAREYGAPNTFSWDGPDPGTYWGGFQYRGIETVARAWYNDPNNSKAQQITRDFLYAIGAIWPDENHPVIVTFPRDGSVPTGDYDEPHMAAILMRTAIYAYQATTDSVDQDYYLMLVGRCARYLRRLFRPFPPDSWNSAFTNGTWSVDGQSWWNFWGGEILNALSLLLKFSETTFEMRTNIGIATVSTLPDIDTSLSYFVKVKTPIGIQRAGLVPLSDPNALPFFVKTQNGEMALGGSLVVDKRMRLLINNSGNAMKVMNPITYQNIYSDIKKGFIRINSIKGVTLENLSPRQTYSYSANNWGNVFSCKPNTQYMLRFDIIAAADTNLTLAYKDESGTDYGYTGIGSASPVRTVYFSFTTDANAVQFAIYLQTQGLDVTLDNILVLEGDYSNKPVPLYFLGEKSACELVNSRSLEFKMLDGPAGSEYDRFNLVDLVPTSYLPLRRTGDVYDEISDFTLYKRIASDGTVLATPDVVVLNDSLPILETLPGCEVDVAEQNDIFPDIDAVYPV